MQHAQRLATVKPREESGIRPALLDPAIRLFGNVDNAMFEKFQEQLAQAIEGTDDEIAVELSTTGGDAETARRIAFDIRMSQQYRGRRLLFFGKSFVYSAGIIIMSAFGRNERFLSKDCLLLIHARRMDKQVHFFGPLASNVQIAEELLGELNSGIALERAGFRDLAAGSKITAEEIEKRATRNWYASADEALQCGLVAELI